LADIQAVAPSTIGIKTDVIKLGTLGTLRVRRPTINPVRLRRHMLKGLALSFQHVMTNTTVSGLENIPEKGPLLILPNHVSNLDGIMVMAYFPRQIEMVGPGDFQMITIKDWMLKGYGVTVVNRGHADKSGLKRMIAHLKAGKDLLMFPGGGMWEKRVFESKDGAAYLSQLTQAQILPVGLSGTYLKSNAAFMGHRPKLHITFGKVMPAVPPSSNRRMREADLAAASQEIMDRIYDLMEPGEQAQYDTWAREIYRMDIAFERMADGELIAYDGPPIPDMAALAEFIDKPNLFRPMWENAGLDIDPFRQAAFFAPIEVRLAARDMGNLLAGEYDRYIPYRMGEAAAEQVGAALDALRTYVAEWAMVNDARIRLTPIRIDPEA
jgi:1-acyl-sn-glycerol-3-phosphate acyltransferase